MFILYVAHHASVSVTEVSDSLTNRLGVPPARGEFRVFSKTVCLHISCCLEIKVFWNAAEEELSGWELYEIFSQDFVADSRTMRRANSVLNGGDVAEII